MTLEHRRASRASREPDNASGDAEVHSITDAATAHSEEMRQRMIKYAVAMGIRMVCLILVFVLDGWLKIIAVAGAVFLPWIAVVIANGGDKAEIHSDSLLESAPLAEIDAPEPVQQPAGEDQMVVLQGELLEDNGDNIEGEERAAS
ncbi:DUF3099 domain-containing protein [Arthrobacter rhizosphaerae]|uniref:DUF3099 domain-containing protein n=1 Tax=Arthrobacter rhizosphaerae TaxID=2855490 RepID=UPI001FF4E78F|nr:DUF3099 domain-containing protein [Arthrobacter rhizosphaerae]